MDPHSCLQILQPNAEDKKQDIMCIEMFKTYLDTNNICILNRVCDDDGDDNGADADADADDDDDDDADADADDDDDDGDGDDDYYSHAYELIVKTYINMYEDQH